MKDWEGWSDAHNIEVETLSLNGRYDEITDLLNHAMVLGTYPSRNGFTFENSSHMAHYEARERYMQVCGEFLSSNFLFLIVVYGGRIDDPRRQWQETRAMKMRRAEVRKGSCFVILRTLSMT